MTKPLNSFPEPTRRQVAIRRTANRTEGGLGFVAALDYLSIKKAESKAKLAAALKKKVVDAVLEDVRAIEKRGAK
jgi:hypothetical protein